MPAVKEQGENLLILERDIDNFKLIVQRFDEIILHKASKISLSNLQLKIDKCMLNSRYKEGLIKGNQKHQQILQEINQ